MADRARASSIKVAVRVRPFNNKETTQLISPNNNNDDDDRYMGNGIWKLVDCIDDKMLIFDPLRTPLNIIQGNALNSLYSQRIRSRRSIKFNQIFEDNDISDDSQEIKFVFDKLFDENACQEDVYEDTTSSLIDSVIEGYNATVFAYGATGCGKTYTISGTPEEPGIIFQAMQDLFHRIEQLADEQEFKISISFLEIYNERIRDLLEPETNYKKLVIREDDNQHTTVANLSHHYPDTVQDVIDLVIRGNINRTTSATEANEVSSRSHAVLQVHVIQTNKKIDFTTDQKYATLSIIDLAGSERAASTKNRGQRLHEGANINRSLLALGNCINALCIEEVRDSKRIVNHIPYRDSKLTRLLKFSLGGNCQTVMIVCISPSSLHYDETLNTLKYANRAKEIKTKIIRNQQTLNKHVGSYLKMINEQKIEIERLRKREASMIELRLKNFKLNLEKIELRMDKIMNNIVDQYDNNPRFQLMKRQRSITLVKRRFLQLIKIEIDNIMKYITDYTDLQIINTATMVQLQLIERIRLLETKFDAQDELDAVIINVKKIDLIKLKEMEDWNDSIHERQFNDKISQISMNLRNEIMINSSIMIENLINNDTMISYFKFFSNCLINENNILTNLQKLEKIDEIFNNFIETVQDKTSSSIRTVSIDMTSDENEDENENEKEKEDNMNIVKKLRWSDSLVESQKNELGNGNISLIDTTMTTQDSLQNDINLHETNNNYNDDENENENENSYDNSIINTSYSNNSNKRSSFLLNRNFLTNDSS